MLLKGGGGGLGEKHEGLERAFPRGRPREQWPRRAQLPPRARSRSCARSRLAPMAARSPLPRAARPDLFLSASAARPRRFLPPPPYPPGLVSIPRSHQPLVLITRSESQRIQPQSRAKGASGSAGKGQRESGESGGEAGVGLSVNAALYLKLSRGRQERLKGSGDPGPSERTAGSRAGQPPFKFPSCRR